MSTTLFGINHGIYSLNELHTLGLSMNEPEAIVIVKEGLEHNGLIVYDDDNAIIACSDLVDGYVSLEQIIAADATIKPERYCVVYIKPDELNIAKLDNNTISYNEVNETLDEFYAHGDRIIVREICTVYDQANPVKAYKDSEVVEVPAYVNDMVALPTGLAFGKYEVTRSLYKAIMNCDPSAEYPNTEDEGDNRPVDNIELADAVAFCNALSVKEGLVPFYADEDGTESEADNHENGYRLPTKLEWEDAALAGATTTYAGTDGSLPQCNNDSHQLVFTSDPVGYEEDDKGNAIPVYDETSSFSNAPENGCTNPNNTSIANVGDSELARYAWTKYNIRTGECENVPQPPAFIEGYGQWRVYKYKGVYYKSNAYGQAGCRGDANDNIFGTRAVGQKLPNAWGLYDMTGNASELTLTNGVVLYVGGDAACNTSKLVIGHPTYECKIKGFRICKNV